MANKLFPLRLSKPAIQKLLGLSVCIVIVLGACAPFVAPAGTPTPVVIDLNQLYANPWTLIGYGDPNNPTVVPQGLNLTAEFTTEGQVSGFGGCNNFSGPYQAGTDGTMKIGPLVSTMMACDQGSDQEKVYLAALQSAQSFSFDSQGRLEIKYQAGVLIFIVEKQSLTDTNWVLVSMGDPNSQTAVPAGVVITAQFSTDGHISGLSGCNQYNATYTVQGEQLTVGPVAGTQMACPTGMDTEQAYLQALGTAQQATVNGPKLTITYNQGAGVLTYTSASLPLTYTVWTLATMNGQQVPVDTFITALFTPTDTPDTGNISGNSGCNTYNAGYTVSGNNLTVEPATSTMMACPTGMDLEQSYLQALQASTTYQIQGDTLTLTSSSGSLIYSANRTPVTGALWTLVSIGDVNNPQPPVAGSHFAAQFSRVPNSPSGFMTGTTGCNEYSAAFAASVTEIKINPPVSTDNKSCAPGLSDQEQLYYLALNDATTYSITGNTLIMPYDSGKQALVFEGTQVESANRPPLSDLNGTTWYLWFINNAPAVAGTSVYGLFTINADGGSGTLSGSAGCNAYIATFGQDMGVQTTLNAQQVCNTPAGIMDQERNYVSMLQRAYGYWQTGDQLIINTGLGALTYRNTQPPQTHDQTHLLVGPTWYLTSYQSSYSVAGTQEPYTLFNTNGTLTGFTGCNSFQGNYTTSVQHITITNLNANQSACPNSDLQRQQDAMLGILRTAKDFQVVETVMQIVGDQGALNYSLTPLHRPEEAKPPTASFTGPKDIPVGQVAKFDGTSSSGPVPIVYWEWSFGDGIYGTGPVVDHVYYKPGSVRVTLTVTDQRGYQSSQQQTLNVTNPAPVQPTPTGVPPTATAQPTQGPQPTQPPTEPPTQPPQPTQAPTQAPTQPPQPTQPPTEAPTQPPVPTVPTATAEIAPPIVLPPQASIQGPSSGYIGEPVTFDASGSTAGSSPIASYSWNFGDGTSTGPFPTATTTTLFNKTGNYQVTVVVTDQSGQSSSATMSIKIGSRLNTPVVWMLNQMGSQAPLPGTAITLQFVGGQVAGFAGCNSYTGSYTATQNEDGSYTVAITGLTNTGKACPSEIMQQEQTYLTMLGAATTAQNQGSSLSLTSPQGSLGYSQAP